MKTIYVSEPLGIGNVYAPRKKEWINLALAGAGVLSSIWGGKKASDAAEQSLHELRAQKAKNEAWYNRNYYQDYIDTNAGQNTVRTVKDAADRIWKKASGASAVAGGTAAQEQMAKDAGNKMVGDAIANIAATDVMRKDRVDAQHRADEQNYTQQKMNIENQRAQNITNASQQASNALLSAASALGQDGGAAKLKGGDNASTPIESAAKSAYYQAKIDAAKNNIGNDPIAQQINAATQPDPFKYLKQQ